MAVRQTCSGSSVLKSHSRQLLSGVKFGFICNLLTHNLLQNNANFASHENRQGRVKMKIVRVGKENEVKTASLYQYLPSVVFLNNKQAPIKGRCLSISSSIVLTLDDFCKGTSSFQSRNVCRELLVWKNHHLTTSSSFSFVQAEAPPESPELSGSFCQQGQHSLKTVSL